MIILRNQLIPLKTGNKRKESSLYFAFPIQTEEGEVNTGKALYVKDIDSLFTNKLQVDFSTLSFVFFLMVIFLPCKEFFVGFFF